MTEKKKTRACPHCGGGPVTSSTEDYVYDESGLTNLVLEGIEVRRCAACAAVSPVVPGIEALHRAVARMLVSQPCRLNGEEVRFLRKYLGFRSSDFAEIMGVAKETVSRWEHDHEAVGGVSDRLLRTLVTLQRPVTTYDPEEFPEILRRISDDGARHRRRAFSRSHGAGWVEAAA